MKMIIFFKFLTTTIIKHYNLEVFKINTNCKHSVWKYSLLLIFIGLTFFTINASADSYDYKSLLKMNLELLNLVNTNPSIAKIEYLTPKTYEGRSIIAIKISDNPTKTENEQRLLFVGTHHAQEWISAEVPFQLAKYLVQKYNSNPDIKAIVDNTEIWIIPVVNPDGYEYS